MRPLLWPRMSCRSSKPTPAARNRRPQVCLRSCTRTRLNPSGAARPNSSWYRAAARRRAAFQPTLRVGKPAAGKASALQAPAQIRILAHHAPDELCVIVRSEEHTSELQSQSNLVCRLLLEKKKKQNYNSTYYTINTIQTSD